MSGQVDNASQALDRLKDVALEVEGLHSRVIFDALATVRRVLSEQEQEIERLRRKSGRQATNIDALYRQKRTNEKRAEAAEAEVERYREGLRPFVEDFDFHAADYLAERVDGEEARVFTARTVDLLIEHQRKARALLAGNEAEPDGGGA